MAERSSNSTFMVPLVAGLAGAMAALLLAPRSGKETRQQLRSTTEDIQKKAAEGIDTARATMEEMLSRGKDVSNRMTSTIRSKSDKIQSGFEEARDSDSRTPRSTTMRTWEEEV